AWAGHEAKQVAIKPLLFRIAVAASIEHPGARRDEGKKPGNKQIRAEFSPAPPERDQVESVSACHPVKIIKPHHVPVAAVFDPITMRQGSAPPLVEAGQQVMNA